MMFFNIIQDGFFAAIASIGFASISNPPKQAYPCCAIAAAVGHALRYVLMSPDLFHIHIVLASTITSLFVGLISVFLSKVAKCPAEACFAPALLPMIPGMYAYKSIAALILSFSTTDESLFMHYMYLLCFNGMTCVFIVLGMVVGATIPVFLFKNISFHATRQ